MLKLLDFITVDEENALISLERTYSGTYRTKQTQPGRMIRFGDFTPTHDLIVDSRAIRDGYKGARRSYSQMNDGIDISVSTENEPSIIKTLKERLFNNTGINLYPNVAVLNVYRPGQRIGPHIDHVDNGPIIPIINLQSDSKLIFTKHGEPTMEVVMYRRSLLLMSGEYRYEWKHETPAIDTPRMSLVFRCLPKGE